VLFLNSDGECGLWRRRTHSSKRCERVWLSSLACIADQESTMFFYVFLHSVDRWQNLVKREARRGTNKQKHMAALVERMLFAMQGSCHLI